MDDLERYSKECRKRSTEFTNRFKFGCGPVKIGVIRRAAREESGLAQDDLAERPRTKKSAISRIENHAEDIRLSTLKKFAEAIGKRLTFKAA